jgi:hypothetical protein
MPFAGSTTDRKLDPADYQTLLKTLAGTDPTLNPRRIKSLDLSAGDYQDAWGNDLQVVIDFDYDVQSTTPWSTAVAGSKLQC